MKWYMPITRAFFLPMNAFVYIMAFIEAAFTGNQDVSILVYARFAEGSWPGLILHSILTLSMWVGLYNLIF